MSDSPEADPAASAGAPPAEGEAGARTPYRVLARKYRPASFEDLIGQDALVRTLTNAIEAGRMPQAFVLTGVRGVGKTTTARIIARALNCIGAEGQGGPTIRPCGVCEHCTAIANDRHVDVIEMDAASRTGVDDIRDLIDGVRYRPTTARRKVYIVDEVHMLSRNAFNALLKTLEEPPEHVTFVFATTEIRKVPVTVLSRCMRFDLRRVEQDTLVRHFAGILQKEGVAAEDAALQMVARAADGSVRDGLSLLDQAIALSGGSVSEALVKEMLGLADRGRIYDLYDAVLGGRAAEALDVLADLYAAGADPAVVLQDLLEVTHTLTRLQVVGVEATAGLPEVERTRGKDMADALGRGTLARNWQILLKGLQETQVAPQPRQAAEMVLLRLIHAGELPLPADLVKQLKEGAPAGGTGAAGGSGGGGRSGGDAGEAGRGGGAARAVAGAGAPAAPQPAPEPSGAPRAQAAEAEPAPAAQDAPQPQSFAEVIELAKANREPKLAAELRNAVHLVRFEAGHIELRPTDNAPADLAGRLGRLLGAWTGRRWVVSLSQEAGQATLADQARQQEAETQARLMQHPNVQAVLEHFPGARLVRHSAGAGAAADTGADPATAPGADADHPEDDPADDPEGEAAAGDGGEIDPDDPRFQ